MGFLDPYLEHTLTRNKFNSVPSVNENPLQECSQEALESIEDDEGSFMTYLRSPEDPNAERYMLEASERLTTTSHETDIVQPETCASTPVSPVSCVSKANLPARKRAKYQESNEQDLFQCIKSTNEIIVKSIQEHNTDDSDVFGQLIAIELRKLIRVQT